MNTELLVILLMIALAFIVGYWANSFIRNLYKPKDSSLSKQSNVKDCDDKIVCCPHCNKELKLIKK
jgi:hypothetical protein